MKSEERQFLIESLCEDLVPMIMDKYGLSDKAAIKKLYTSSTFSKLEDPETGLYYQSPVYLFDMLKEEFDADIVDSSKESLKSGSRTFSGGCRAWERE